MPVSALPTPITKDWSGILRTMLARNCRRISAVVSGLSALMIRQGKLQAVADPLALYRVHFCQSVPMKEDDLEGTLDVKMGQQGFHVGLIIFRRLDGFDEGCRELFVCKIRILRSLIISAISMSQGTVRSGRALSSANFRMPAGTSRI